MTPAALRSMGSVPVAPPVPTFVVSGTVVFDASAAYTGIAYYWAILAGC